MKVNGKELLMSRSNPGRERTYLTEQAKGH